MSFGFPSRAAGKYFDLRKRQRQAEEFDDWVKAIVTDALARTESDLWKTIRSLDVSPAELDAMFGIGGSSPAFEVIVPANIPVTPLLATGETYPQFADRGG